MGITQEVYQSIKHYLNAARSICELGAQHYIEGGERLGYFKDIFVKYPIITLDITGENGSLRVNLANPIDPITFQYDVITNFGTSEHVSNQYQCWKNIHTLCKPGGYVISEIPEKGSWKGHCKYYVDKSFFESMDKDFEVVEYRTIEYKDQGNLCFCIQKKVSPIFFTDELELLSTIEIDKQFIDYQGV